MYPYTEICFLEGFTLFKIPEQTICTIYSQIFLFYFFLTKMEFFLYALFEKPDVLWEHLWRAGGVPRVSAL